MFEREASFLEALDSADLDQGEAERVGDVRDAYLDGHIDEQELERRLEGAVANDNRSELSDRDGSLSALVAEVGTAWFSEVGAKLTDLEIERHEFGTNQWDVRAPNGDSPAEAAGQIQTLLTLAPYLLSLFIAILGDLSSSPVVVLLVLHVSLVFILGGLVSDKPEVRVHTPGRGDYVAE